MEHGASKRAYSFMCKQELFDVIPKHCYLESHEKQIKMLKVL